MAQQALGPDLAKLKHHSSWWRVLLIGLLALVVGIVLLPLTQNPNLFPTVVMVGSFLVPVAYVAFFYDHRHLSDLDVPSVAKAFLYGGLLGVLSASVLEPLFIGSLNLVTVFVVGIIEELVKVPGVLIIARHHRHDSELDGMVLGAASGMGFAALESMGYAFSAFMASRGSLSAVVGIMLFRGLLSPMGHGTWTAILVGVLFRESRPGHFRFNGKVLIAYLTVVILHGLWDGLPQVLAMVLRSNWGVPLAQLLVGGVSIFILWRRWREAERLQVLRNATAPAA